MTDVSAAPSQYTLKIVVAMSLSVMFHCMSSDNSEAESHTALTCVVWF